MDEARPSLRRVFVEPARRLKVYFYTSSLQKYLQARIVLEKYGLVLSHFRSRSEPYEERYEQGTQALLTRAIDEIRKVVGHSAVFFVEDTSLRIDALSHAGIDVPGLAVKDWFAGTTFQELDSILRNYNAGRRAIVKSDIAVHLPGLSRPVFFHGETSGQVAPAAPTFSESPQYPWLTPNTFNGWFVPDGATTTLGQMSFEESWRYDFRTKSLVAMVSRLEEYSAALNLPASAHSKRRPLTQSQQLPLRGLSTPLFLVIGHTCSGKTTLGEYASSRLGFRFIEASGVVRFLSGVSDPDPSAAFAAAARVLTLEGPSIVARRVLEFFGDDLSKGAVISGFRTVEEVETIRRVLPNSVVVWIDASERTRFHRALSRSRGASDSLSIGAFRDIDRQQERLGLLHVGRELADLVIVNESSLDDYHSHIRAAVERGSQGLLPPRSNRANRSQIYRFLRILSTRNRAMSTDEIARIASRRGETVRANNVNKTLRSAGPLASRSEREGRINYAIEDAGRSFLRIIDMKAVGGKRRGRK